MSNQLKKGQLFDFLSKYEDKSEFDKLFDEQGLPTKPKRAILHFYTMFFIIETDNELRFYSTTETFIFDYKKSSIPKQLLEIFDLYTTKFDRPFTLNGRKLNYTRAKKTWIKTDEEFPEANINDPLTITYYSPEKKYSLGLLYIYRQVKGNTERLDLRDIDEDFLQEIFNMNVSFYPDMDFSKPSVFFAFFTKLLVQITREIPRKIRPVDIETNIVRREGNKTKLFGTDEILY